MSDLILDENLAQSELKLIPASKNKRFANFIIDYIIAIIFVIIVFVLFELMGVSLLFLEENSLLDRLVGMLMYALFYILVEGSLKGKTPGKYITKTRVVNIDGTTPDMGTFVKRSFSRIVPFEQFSFLGDQPGGWHDRWSDTLVIDETLSNVSEDLNLV